MIIFHAFLKNNLLVTNPKARPRREYDWDHKSMELECRVSIRHECLGNLLTVPETSPEGNGLG